MGGATIPSTMSPIDGASKSKVQLRRTHLSCTGVKIKSVARLGCDRIERDFVAQSFQAPHKTTLHTLAIPLIEVVPA